MTRPALKRSMDDATMVAVRMPLLTSSDALRGETASRKEAVLRSAIETVTDYLRAFGGEQLPRSSVDVVRDNVMANAPGLARDFPAFFAKGFYDSATRSNAERTGIEAEKIARAVRDVVLPSDAARLVERIDELVGEVGEISSLAGARSRASAIATGSIVDAVAPAELEDPQFPGSLLDLVEIRAPESFKSGSTHPRLFVDRAGRKWVLKGGGGPGHEQAEHECSQAYRAIGVRAPASRMYGEYRLAEYIEGQTLGEAMRTSTNSQRRAWLAELRAGFAADVVFGNHDVIGMTDCNVMVGEDGHVWRIDNGGAAGKRAQGGDDKSFFDGWIDDLWTMRGKSPAVQGGRPSVMNPSLVRYFGDMETSEVLAQAAAVDWKKAIPCFQESRFAGEGKGDRVRLSKGRREAVEERVAEILYLARISDSVCRGGGYSSEYADLLVRMCYALCRGNYREVAGAGSRSDGVEMVYDGTPYGCGFARQRMSGRVRSVHSRSPLESENTVDVSGSVDSVMRGVASASGVDIDRCDRMYSDTAYTSDVGTWANRLRVMELNAIGYPLDQIASGAVRDMVSGVADDVSSCARSYMTTTRDQFAGDMAAAMFRKAATMMFLIHCGKANVDEKSQRVLCVSMQPRSSLPEAARPGTVMDGSRTDIVSTMMWNTVGLPYNGDRLVAMSVPISRVMALDVFSNANGDRLFGRQGCHVSECVVNSSGLEFAYLGRTRGCMDDGGKPISILFGAVSRAEQNSGRTLSGSRFDSPKAYRKVCHPWSREFISQDVDAAPGISTLVASLRRMSGSRSVPTGDSWDESKHPRNHGRFARKGDGETSSSTSSNSQDPSDTSRDDAYMDAVGRGDTDAASRMVRAEAARAMPNTKVVDEDGLPKVMFHGTSSGGINQFDLSRVGNWNFGFHFGTRKAAGARLDDDETYDGQFRNPSENHMMPVFLDIRNPFRCSDGFGIPKALVFEELGEEASRRGRDDLAEELRRCGDAAEALWENGFKGESDVSRRATEVFRRALGELGYDGVVYRNDYEGGGDYGDHDDSWLALYPNQIKSASAACSMRGQTVPLSRRMAPSDDIRGSVA